MFWPYAYDDFVDYTFYPHAYDTFWPYAYDDLYEGAFGRYAQGYGGTYASVGRSPKSGAARAVGTDLCNGQTAGLTDWPIERIAQTVEPDHTQRAALDELKGATAKALDVLEAACPTELSSTPTGRIQAMGLRLDAMLQAVRILRPAIEKFYQSLNDEQKARFNALGADDQDQKQSQRDLTQACGERASGIASLPLDRIERAVRPDEGQRGALRELNDATSEAINLLKSDCPSYRALTPVVRLEAMEQRLDAMSRALHTVQPALEKFYGSLGDEQKERFNRLSPAQGDLQRPRAHAKGDREVALRRTRASAVYSAAMRTSGAAERTSASTCFSYLTKFSWNMRTSLRAVSSNSALSFQVFIG